VRLLLQRYQSGPVSTIGELSEVTGDEHDRWCYTCEDVVREQPGIPVQHYKIASLTAIPSGAYQIVMTFSNRFQRVMPLLLEVPGFTGIRIHSGNSANDSSGCILVGFTTDGTRVIDSRAAYLVVAYRIEEALKVGEVWIEIRNAA
jgi:hypothetical protein